MIRPAAVTAACLVVLAGAAGCTGGGHAKAAGKPAPTTSVTGPSTGSPQPSASAPAVETDPAQTLSMPDHQQVLYKTAGRRGSANVTVLPRIASGTLGVAVVCNGPGAIHVSLGGIASFSAGCGTGPGVYNEIALGSARNSVAVSVTGSTNNEWAMTMGWTSHIDKPTG